MKEDDESKQPTEDGDDRMDSADDECEEHDDYCRSYGCAQANYYRERDRNRRKQ